MKSGEKRLFCLTVSALTAWMAFAAFYPAEAESAKAQHKCKLMIHATGFRTDKGKAGAAVYDSPKGWPNKSQQAYTGGEIPKSNGTATFDYQVPPGIYAIVVIDDVNENEKLDRDFIGIPKEGFGFANNPRVFLRAPSFEAASIHVNCPKTETTVRIEYR